MTREQKLALILGFALTLAVTVLISDHLSAANNEEFGDIGINPELTQPEAPHARASFAVADPERSDDPLTRPNREESEPRTLRQDDSLGRSVAELLGNSEIRTLSETEKGRTNPPLTRDEDRTSPRNVEPPVRQETPAASPRRHRIAKGDTLWSIADQYYGDPGYRGALADYNIEHGYLKDRDIIRLGASILIPSPEELFGKAARPDASRPAKAPEKPKAPAYRSYTVRKGDTFWSIAENLLKDGRRYKEIIDLNKAILPDPDRLAVGTTLRIPAD